MSETRKNGRPGPEIAPAGEEHETHWLRWGLLAVGIVVMVVLFYVAENWRGKLAWEQYENQMASRGHRVEWESFMPAPVEDEQNIFAVPEMSAWFLGRGVNLMSGKLSSGRDDFLLQRDTNWVLEVTFVPFDVPLAPSDADLVLSYRDSFLSLAGNEPPMARRSKQVVFPLIVLDHVPLACAITNLALQAGLRCQLDPQTGLGTAHDPEVSIRWSDVTARGALLALLDNYQLASDPKAGPNLLRVIKKDASANVSARLVELIRNAVGSLTNSAPVPSANSVQSFTVFVPAVPVPKPARVTIRSEQVPEAAEVQHLFPNRLFGYVQTLSWPHAQQVGTNRFHIQVSPGRFTSASDYLAWSGQFQPDFDLIREALKRPYARPMGDYAQPANIPVPNFVAVRVLVQTLAQRAQCDLLLGKPEDAFRELSLLHQVCRLLETPPGRKPITLMAAMIDVAVSGLYVGVVEDGLRLRAWKEPQLAAIQAELETIRLLPIVTDAFQTERASVCRVLETASPQQFNQFFSGSSSPTWWDRIKDPRYTLLALAPRGWIYQNMRTIAAYEQKAIDAFDSSGARVLPGIANAFGDDFAGHGLFSAYGFLANLVPNSARAIQTIARNQTLVNEAQVMCALERYRLAWGQYPTTLDALVPETLQEIPLDLIGGRPLKYHLTLDRKVVLYSVGWNETDEGGIPGTKDPTAFDLARGDWVWPYQEALIK